MNIDKKALKGFVDEIEASRERAKGETRHQSDIFKKIKAAQLDAKAVRIVLQRRAMGESNRDQQDYYVHAYELALGGKKAAMEALESGASTREAAKIGGISNGAAAALAKGAQKSSFVSTPPHDHETGEVHDREDTGRANGSAEDHRAHDGPVDGLRRGPEAEGGDREGDEGSGDRSDPAARAEGVAPPAFSPTAVEMLKAIASSVKVQEVGAVSSRPKGIPIDSRTPDEIMGEMPAHLRRVRA